jgi:hypothetical protein
VSTAGLVPREPRQQHDGQRQRSWYPCRAPARHRPLDDPVQQRHHPRGQQQHAAAIGRVPVWRLYRNPRGYQHGRGQRDRHPGPEKRPPAAIVDGQPAAEVAHDPADSGQPRPERHPAWPVRGLKASQRDGEGGGQHQRRAHAAERPSAHEHRGAGGQRGDRRPDGEDEQADQHAALAPEPIAECSGRNQQAREYQRVAVDDPRCSGHRRMQAARLEFGDHEVDRRDHPDHQHHGGRDYPDGPGRSGRAAGSSRHRDRRAALLGYISLCHASRIDATLRLVNRPGPTAAGPAEDDHCWAHTPEMR